MWLAPIPLYTQQTFLHDFLVLWSETLGSFSVEDYCLSIDEMNMDSLEDASLISESPSADTQARSSLGERSWWKTRQAALTATAVALLLSVIVLAAVLTSRHAPSVVGSDAPSLAMPFDGRPMKILIISDVHFGEAEDTVWGPHQDKNSTRVISRVLEAERPDFVVFLGDLVTGENLVNATNATQYLAQMFKPVVDLGIPFASTYGNHDVSNNLERVSIFEFEKQYPRCMTQRSDPAEMSGVTNYVLQVFRKKDSSKDPVFQMVFLDSQGVTGMVNRTGIPNVDWVTAQQLKVLQSAVHGSTVPTYVFFHIQLNQYNELNDEFQDCVGLRNESDFGGQSEDHGLWDLMMDSQNVVATFSGHQHGTGWCCPAQRQAPLTVCFARHTGYGGYGRWARGARVLLVDEMNPSRLETWVRMEDGSVIDGFVR